MENAMFVQKLECQRYLRCVELCCLLREHPCLLQLGHQATSTCVLLYEKQVFLQASQLHHAGANFHADSEADIMKPVVAFHDFVNAPKNV